MAESRRKASAPQTKFRQASISAPSPTKPAAQLPEVETVSAPTPAGGNQLMQGSNDEQGTEV